MSTHDRAIAKAHEPAAIASELDVTVTSILGRRIAGDSRPIGASGGRARAAGSKRMGTVAREGPPIARERRNVPLARHGGKLTVPPTAVFLAHEGVGTLGVLEETLAATFAQKQPRIEGPALVVPVAGDDPLLGAVKAGSDAETDLVRT
jgi:hypothetical protein